MPFDGPRTALATGAALAMLQATAAFPQVEAVQAIQNSALIDVPLVLGDIEPKQAGGVLWAKGDRPSDTLFARFTVRPVQVAALIGTPGGQTGGLLWRAFRGGGVTRMRADELELTQGPRYFCSASASASSCYVDEDADGRFDHAAEAVLERGRNPYHLTVIKAARPLATPMAYRILADAERPAVTIQLDNCAKDYDRPRFAARSIADRAAPPVVSAFAWIAKDSTFATCRRSERLESAPGGAWPQPGGFLAKIGPFAFMIGAKNDPRFALVGPVDPQALYRIEGASLVDMRVGFTPEQASLVALKKFPYPMMMTDEGAAIQAGQVAQGALMATIPFHHAYRGRLTQDVTISTLFGKRSLAAGTIVYGFPARSSISVSRGGIPAMSSVGDEDFRKVDLELTWCAPIHDPAAKEKPGSEARNGWSAACIPHSVLGNHTILTDRNPAFAISGLSYDATTSSNDGSPPIERADQAAFDKPLRIDYVYEGRDGEFVRLAMQIRYGDEVTSSRPERIYAPTGTVDVIIAGTPVSLATTATGDLSVTTTGAPVPGADPLLQWDQRAMLRKQFEKMGLKIRDETDGPAGSPEN